MEEKIEIPTFANLPMKHRIGMFVVSAIATFVAGALAERAYIGGVNKYHSRVASKTK